ncbi:MAG: flagellar basal body rod protein FlgB [Gammaproteobacteria bacterium]|jgi:flagellar basal-body rod protein FlgB
MKLDDAFSLYEHTVKLRARRAEVLAANMANADTPGYRARDFDFRQVLERQTPQVAPVRLVSTHAAHLDGGRELVSPAQLKYRIPQQPTLDGNTVEVEVEQAQFSKNAMAYQASLRFLDGRIKSLKSAISGE